MKNILCIMALVSAMGSHATNIKDSSIKSNNWEDAQYTHLYRCKGAEPFIGGTGPATLGIVVLHSNDDCSFERSGPVVDLYVEIMNQIRPQLTLLASNYKEMITQYVNNTAAQADANVKNISTKVTGTMKMRIDGIVDSQGYVPVTFSNFGLHGVGKLRKYQLGLRIHIYINIKYNNLFVKGKYNINTGHLIANPDISSYKPEVYTDVDLPFFLQILDDLTPEIFNKLQTEFGRIVTDVFEFFGVDMSQSIPQAIQHTANTIPESFTQIPALDNYNTGDHIIYEMNINPSYASISDGENVTSVEYIHMPLR